MMKKIPVSLDALLTVLKPILNHFTMNNAELYISNNLDSLHNI